MVKFAASGVGRTLVGLGLEAENITRLQKKQPIRVRFADLGFTGALGTVEIMIFAGKDAASMRLDLADFIGLDTVIFPE
jgi:hypothetical protein